MIATNDIHATTAYESYPNWKHLIEPLVNRSEEVGAEILQIKQKFGGLRFYVRSNDEQLHQMIEDAEVASYHIPPRGANEKDTQG